VYGIFERADVSLTKKDDYFTTSFTQSVPQFYRLENEAGFGIGADIYIEPGENLKLDFVWGSDGIINIIPRNNNSGNNTLFRSLNDSMKSVYQRIASSKIIFSNSQSISHFVDSIYNISIEQVVSELRKNTFVSNSYEKNILLPQLELYKDGFKNILLRKSDKFNSPEFLFYNDSLMLNPGYSFWTKEFEYNSFRSYLYEKINNQDAGNFRTFINNIVTKYPFNKDSLLYRIALSNGIKEFFQNYLIAKSDFDETIFVADSLINALNLNKAKLVLPDFMESNKQAIALTEINLINILSLSTQQPIALKEIFSDTTKIYLIDHWASWCGPCLKEMPFSIALQKKYSSELQIIYLSKDTKIEASLDAIKKTKLPIENCFILDYSKTTDDDYKIINPSPALPFYQFVYFSNGKYYLKSATRPSDDEIGIQIKNISKMK
jgi:thiol-disulfide isomerase/thioredoxin